MDPYSFFKEIELLVNDSDHLILNLETVLENNPISPLKDKEYLNWDKPSRTINVLKQLGVSAVTLANNHTMDFGPEIMLKTKQQLLDAGIKCFGAGSALKEAPEPLEINISGEQSTKTVYVLSGMRASKRYREDYVYFADHESPGVNPLDLNSMTEQITSLRKNNPESIIIIFPHWQGIDYKWVSPKIKDTARGLIDAGANYIFAHGTHMINPIEKYKSGFIAYSIGNFVFNSPGRYKKLGAPPYSFIIHLELSEQYPEWKVKECLYPIFSDNKESNFTPRPVNENEAIEIELLLENKIKENALIKIGRFKDKRGFYFSSAFNDPSYDGNIKSDSSTKNRTTSNSTSLQNLDKESNQYEKKTFSTKTLIAQEFAKHGFQSEFIGKFLVTYFSNERVVFFETESSLTSLVGWRIIKNKVLAKKFLSSAGVSVAKGKYFNKKDKQQALNFIYNYPLCVIKPSDGRKGKGITVGVSNEEEFDYAWKTAITHSEKGILVEEQFTGGTEARYLVVDGKCVAVLKRIPPMVFGNGIDTIEMLIEKKNNQKLKNPNLKNKLIKIDHHRSSMIKTQGFKITDIPPNGTRIIIDWKAGLSTGADSYDYTDEIHSGFKKIAEKAAVSVPGLDIAGIDILAHDHTLEPTDENYIVIEVNTRPGIGGHHYPVYGKPRNVVKDIVKYVIKKMKEKGAI